MDLCLDVQADLVLRHGFVDEPRAEHLFVECNGPSLGERARLREERRLRV